MMAIPKRTEEILEEQLQEKNATTLPMEPGTFNPLDIVPKSGDLINTFNSGGHHPGTNVTFNPSSAGGANKPPTDEAEAPAEDKQPEGEKQETPNENQDDSGKQSKGLNLSLDIPRVYLNVATPANPVSASKGEQRLVKLVNELIPAKEANTDEDGFAMQEFIRNNIQISTSWQ
jgi:hypothetical protein